jgi:hypothetical protein
MGASNIHLFNAIEGKVKDGLYMPHVAIVRQPTNDVEPEIVKAGRALLFGSPRGVVDVQGERHYKLFAAREGKQVGDDVRAMFEGEGDAPRIVRNRMTDRDVAFEGTVVNIGPRQYTITGRKAGDGTHLIHVRTGVVRAKGQTYEDALAQFFAANKLGELGQHGSYGLDRETESTVSVEEHVQHLKWNVARTRFEREDGIKVPVNREDAWKVPEGCKVLVVDPSIGDNGFQRCFTLAVENNQIVMRSGGKREFDQFMELEDRRLKKRKSEAQARGADSQA